MTIQPARSQLPAISRPGAGTAKVLISKPSVIEDLAKIQRKCSTSPAGSSRIS